jgi:hypothetical protein
MEAMADEARAARELARRGAAKTAAGHHRWERGVNQFTIGHDDAYEYECVVCGTRGYVETGRKGREPRGLPIGPCPGGREG